MQPIFMDLLILVENKTLSYWFTWLTDTSRKTL